MSDFFFEMTFQLDFATRGATSRGSASDCQEIARKEADKNSRSSQKNDCITLQLTCCIYILHFLKHKTVI